MSNGVFIASVKDGDVTKQDTLNFFCQANRIGLCTINYCKCILMSGLRRHCRRSSTAMYWNKNKILLVNADYHYLFILFATIHTT